MSIPKTVASPWRSARAGVGRHALAHASVVGLFSVVAVWLTYPLVWHLDTHLPGLDAGDNVTFLWNAWWFDEWASGRAERLFFTDRLFAPFGTPLVLHTHTALPSALAFLVPLDSIVARHNLILIVGLAANGIAAYALAFWHVRKILPSVAAGVVFSASAYLCVHLLGHFNLLHAWVLPVMALAWLRFTVSPSTANGTLLAVALAAVVYTDYYYLVYAALLIAIWLVERTVWMKWSLRRRPWNGVMSVLATAVLLLGGLIAAIAVLGDLSFDLFGQRVSMRHARNPLTLLCLVLLGGAIYALRPRIATGLRPSGWDRRWAPGVVVCLTVAFVLTLPITRAAFDLIVSGDYVSQRSLWRSSPAGVDLLTLVAGHPSHSFTGGASQALLHRLDIDLVEQVAWVSLVALIVVWRSRVARTGWPLWSFWMTVAIVFTILAAGPFLRIAGIDTGLPLPWAALRYVFPFSNARIPGRAIVMTLLAVAMLLAFSMTSLRQARWLILGLLLLEALPAPVPLYELPRQDEIDAYLREVTVPGAVVELPAGLRDGFGETGRLDHRALVHQLHHARPIVGGFVGRLSPRIANAYATDNRLNAWLELSAEQSADPAIEPAHEFARVPFVVINADRFQNPEAVRQAVVKAGYAFVRRDGARELYQRLP